MVRTGRQAIRKAESRIIQLCCLELGHQIAIPAILRELHGYVGSQYNYFICLDPEGEVYQIFDEKIGWDEHPCIEGFKSLTDSHDRPYTDGNSFDLKLSTVVRRNGKALGVLAMQRTPGDSPFSQEDARRLERILPFISEALSAPHDPTHEWIDSEDEGLIVIDRFGKILSVSPSGHDLLAMANGELLNPQENYAESHNSSELLRMVGEKFITSSSLECSPQPTYLATIHNFMGRFVFRAFSLYSQNGSGESIAIILKRQELLPLKLMEQLKELPLSSKQAEVCLLMAMGHSYNQIALRHSMKRSTAISHGRQIYARLGVHNREQLLDTLLKPHSSA